MANLNIPSKNTGDTLSADEFNQVVSAVNSKVDVVSGKGLSTNDYTSSDKSTLTSLPDQIASLSEQVSQIISGSQVIQDTERICGSYRIGGNELNLYECAFKLDELPTAAGTTKEYEISETPLGKNTYLAINSFAVSDGTNFYPHKYSIEKAYVNSDYKTKVVVKCESVADTTCFGILHLQYVKLEYELVEFVVKGLTGDAATNAALTMPIFKYDKKFAYSYTFDDDTILAYSRGHLFINRKWQDAEKNFHVGMSKTTGSYPEKTLGYTDGLGVEHRFTLGVSIWPDSSNQNIDNFMNPTTHKPDKYYPYLVWGDIRPMLDFGHEIYFHDVNTNGDDTVNGIVKGMKKSQAITLSQLPGHGMKTLAEPNGNHDYVLAGEKFEDVSFMCAQGSTPLGLLQNISFAQDIDLKNKVQYRRFVESTPDADALMTDITAKATSGLYQWYHDFSHGPAEHQFIKDLYVKLNDTYGKDGTDTMIFASLDEIYEYWFIRRYAKIRKEVAADGVKFSILIPKEQYFRHKEFTIQLNGTYSSSLSAELTKGEVYGFKFGNINNKFSINIDLERRAYEMADKYSNLYLENQDSEVRDDAVYFINQLRSDLQTVFNDRLSSIDTAPTLNSISIDGGASTTNSKQVTISFNRTGVITHYKLSESSNLDGVEWIASSATTAPFTLSSGYGIKKIYAKIKNEYGESDIVSASISYEEAVTDALVLNSMSINGGAGSTNSRNVTISMSVTGVPTQYMISESSSFSGASWLTYSGTSVPFTLSNGNGAKTVYLKLRNANITTSVLNDTINLQEVSESSVVKISANSSCTESGYNVFPNWNKTLDMLDVNGQASGLVWVGAWLWTNDSAYNSYAQLQGLKSPSGGTQYGSVESDECIYSPYSVWSSPSVGHSNSTTEWHAHAFKTTPGARYKISLFSSLGGNSVIPSDSTMHIFDINGQQKSPSFSLKNNYANVLIWEDVAADSDGWLIIKFGRKASSWITTGANVFEFERIL